jgi:hypothetical protein
MVSEINDENINNIIAEENLDVCIISFGGCGSNTLNSKLQENYINCNTELWRTKLCHYPKKININIPVIYIYRDPIRAFLSMRRRWNAFYKINQIKLSNGNNDIVFSDENLLYLMIEQFYNWTNEKSNNVLIVKYDELFAPEIKNKLENFLTSFNVENSESNVAYVPCSLANNPELSNLNINKYKRELHNFPITFINPTVDDLYVNNLNTSDIKLFNKYKKDIDYINNFLVSCE